jgi:hypothetical protein
MILGTFGAFAFHPGRSYWTRDAGGETGYPPFPEPDPDPAPDPDPVPLPGPGPFGPDPGFPNSTGFPEPVTA